MPLRDRSVDDADAAAEPEPASRVELRTLSEKGSTAVGAPDSEASLDEYPTRPDIPAAFPFLARVPVLITRREELLRLPLDHRAGFLLSLMDGRSSVGAILDACAMPSEEALAILNALLAQHVVRLEGC